MPITVRHTPVGTLGRLATMAGQARGSQIQADRDLQLTSLAMAAQDRSAQIGLAARNRTFGLQRAAATQVARQRSGDADFQKQRRSLQQFVSEADEAGIYTKAQIKQAGLFADLGDDRTVRGILSRISEPSAQRKELTEQRKALTELEKGAVGELQKQLDTVSKTLGQRYTPGIQKLLRERPEFMETVSPETQEQLGLQQQLEEQIADVRQRIAGQKQLLRIGVSVPQQLAAQDRQQAAFARQEASAQQRIESRAGRLTDRQELALDLLRDPEKAQRSRLYAEITRLSKTLGQFKDEGDKDHAERVLQVRSQIRLLELDANKSFARETQKVGEFLGQDQAEVTPIVTDAVGGRWRFTGRYQNGKPLYEEIE